MSAKDFTESNTLNVMNPAGSAFLPGPGVPPLPYETHSTFYEEIDTEIPEECLTVLVQSGNGERDAVNQPQQQYVNDPKPKPKPKPMSPRITESDTNTVMNPAGSAFVPGPGVPPLPYETCLNFYEEIYTEIPGEYLTVHSGKVEQDAVDQPKQQYGNDPKPKPKPKPKMQLHGDTEKEGRYLSVQEVYGN
jgi:hypothetical protein